MHPELLTMGYIAWTLLDLLHSQRFANACSCPDALHPFISPEEKQRTSIVFPLFAYPWFFILHHYNLMDEQLFRCVAYDLR